MEKLLQIALLLVVAAAFANADAELNAIKFKTADHSSAADRDALWEKIFSKYNRDQYPENSTLKFGLSVLNVEFCEDHQLMNTNAWLRLMWSDTRLVWDAEATGISVLRVPPSKVWLPDITLYNSVKPTMDCMQTNTILYPNGNVLWVPPCSFKTYCNLTLADHPNEEQRCALKFGSWTFDGETMGLEFWGNKTEADIDYYFGKKYKFTHNAAVKEEKYYSCCAEPYLDIMYTLGLTKRSHAEMTCNQN